MISKRTKLFYTIAFLIFTFSSPRISKAQTVLPTDSFVVTYGAGVTNDTAQVPSTVITNGVSISIKTNDVNLATGAVVGSSIGNSLISSDVNTGLVDLGQNIAASNLSYVSGGNTIIQQQVLQIDHFGLGGGAHSQAQALSHGLARALAAGDLEVKKILKKNGLLTRDDRVKERKKPGLKRARRAPQWAKR